MKTWHKILVVTLFFGVLTFLSNPNGPLGAFWAPDPSFPVPSSGQLPLFLFLNIAESLVFGLGIAFLMFGYPLVQGLGVASKGLTWAAFISIVWLLISWWPHDSLHVFNGMNLTGLLVIEYLFHLTLMITGLILAYFFIAIGRRASTNIGQTT